MAVTLQYHLDWGRVNVEQTGGGSGRGIKRATMFWFAYDAHYPKSPVYSSAGGEASTRGKMAPQKLALEDFIVRFRVYAPT